MNTEFFKVFGIKERHDELLKLSEDHYVLFWGFIKNEESEENGYCWRKDYDHKPTAIELKGDLVTFINSLIDAKILSGFTYEGNMVWLSQENCFNYKAAFDLCMMTDGANLPVTFKFGNVMEPVYKKFETKEEIKNFFTSAMSFIQATLKEGWNEKDSINLTVFGL